MLFQELIDVEGDGMADMVFRCIQEMDIDNRMMVCGFERLLISYTSALVLKAAWFIMSKSMQSWHF